MWNETTDLQMKAAARNGSQPLEDMLGHLLLRKVAGQNLLCQLHEFGIDDVPTRINETLVAVRSRLHLMSVVSFGLGIMEVWLMKVQRCLERAACVSADEDFVVEQLLATTNETC